MTRPEYVVTRNGSASSTIGLMDFGPAVGKLHKLEVDKNGHIFYVPIADGKIGELAKLAEELNAANEPMAETASAEPVTAEPVTFGPGEVQFTVGIPTVEESAKQAPHMRPGWEPLWILRELNQSLSLVNEGKINLVVFKNRIAKIEEQMMEDIPK